MKIKFFCEKKKGLKIKKNLFLATSNLLDTGKYTNGTYVSKFEEKFKIFMSSKYCIAVNSGTSALHLSLIALGIKEGDEVLLPSISFVASAAAITYVGAKPVFVDINYDDWLIDVNKIEKQITKKTKAIMPVHLHGLICDMKKIKKIANKYNLKIIEDASQAHGSEYYGKKPGYYGDVATFSFYPTKNLGAFGEGGAIVTKNKNVKDIVSKLRAWAPNKKNFFAIGYNYRMPEIIGASLLEKIKYLKQDIRLRIKISKFYKKELNIKKFSKFDEKIKKHSYHLFAIRVKKRDLFMKYLNQQNIQSAIHYSYVLPKLEIFKKYSKKIENFKVAEKLSKELVSIPIYPELSKKEQIYVVKSINKTLSS
ncbi:DegT/DnrJ/EryC1/StrS family aminotransferase [Candidatus Pelagibacter sp.]|nr:DegT/DnrJ/EryC1/StrS family aminotransferase [Candidatus Pelagibacter sp.]